MEGGGQCWTEGGYWIECGMERARVPRHYPRKQRIPHDKCNRNRMTVEREWGIQRRNRMHTKRNTSTKSKSMSSLPNLFSM